MEEKIFGYMTVSHYETITTFPPEIQDNIFDYIRGVEGRDLKTASVKKFSETLYENFATLLSSLPWQEEGCGECPACKERKTAGYLFANLIPEPRCMNREYLERKRKEYVATLAAEKPEAVLVSQKYQVKDEENPQEDDPLSENEVLGPGTGGKQKMPKKELRQLLPTVRVPGLKSPFNARKILKMPNRKRSKLLRNAKKPRTVSGNAKPSK